jgi:hypothetical protein
MRHHFIDTKMVMEQAHVIEVKNLQQDEPTDYSVCTTYRACVARWLFIVITKLREICMVELMIS